MGDPYGVAYMGGCKFRLTLSNAGSSPLTIISMKFASQWQLIDPLTLKRKEITFRGVRFPHQLFLRLTKQGFYGSWLLSEGNRMSDRPRRFDGSAPNLFDSEGHSRLMFDLDPGQSEIIDGAIQPEDDGLYEVRLSALATNARGERSAKAMKATRIAKVSFK